MTPTPQERTELKFAEFILDALNEDAYHTGTERTDLQVLASALLSLAAESEELRAELEKERLRAPGGMCEVCWSNSWAPCAEDTPNAVPDFSTRDWMVCELCSAQERVMSAVESRRTLESRYTALEKALRDAVEAADAGSGTVSLKELRRILALTPKEGE